MSLISFDMYYINFFSVSIMSIIAVKIYYDTVRTLIVLNYIMYSIIL